MKNKTYPPTMTVAQMINISRMVGLNQRLGRSGWGAPVLIFDLGFGERRKSLLELSREREDGDDGCGKDDRGKPRER